MTLGPLTFWPAAFWLIPPVLAVLIWLRYFRTRRQEVLAGSLLLWRRLAAQQPRTPPRRILIDRTLMLQALALLALIAALAAPQWSLNQARGRALLLLVDNGSVARARRGDGNALWSEVLEKSALILRQLGPADSVFLARSAPSPKLLNAQGLSPSAALELLRAQKPALSGPDAPALWLFAADTARSLGKDTPLALAVVSLQERAGADSAGRQWLCVAPATPPANTGIVDFGATPITQDGQAATQVLARLKNFSTQPAEGTVALETSGDSTDAQTRKITLEPNSEQAVVFTLTKAQHPLRISWRRGDGKTDSLPEDDSIVAAPRPVRIPRVRFHAPVPALQRLYDTALKATFIGADDAAGADLEIYAGSVPDKVPAASRAFMLLAPEAGYHSFYDVGAKTLSWPKAQRDETHWLTRGIGDKTESLFAVPKACELLKTGDFTTVVKDAASERALVAAFLDEQHRPAFVLAFVPGAGMPPEKFLEPELAAILVRAALHAAGSGDPFQIVPAAQLELAAGEPLAADWKPEFAVGSKSGAGVLNESVSALSVGRGGGEAFDLSALQPLERGREWDLRPWLIFAALALLAWESFGARTAAPEPRAAKLEA